MALTVNIRCTAKLLKVLGKGLVAQAQTNEAPEDPGDWYANLLWMDGKKCALFTQSGTLFPVFALDVTAAELREPAELLRRGLVSVLELIDVPRAGIDKMVAPLETWALAPSKNRRFRRMSPLVQLRLF